MGQTNSIPSGTRYRMSFCEPGHFYNCTKVYKTVDLSQFVKGSNVSQFVKGYNLIYSSFLYKIIFNGFNIKKVNNGCYEKGYLDEIIHDQINALGAKQVKLQPICYFPTLANIQKLLSSGNILIAGLFINQDLYSFLGLGEITPKGKKISDIVLLVGYDEINLFVIFDWKMGITLLPIAEFRNNFKEIWNIDLISPEEYFLNLNVPE
jgi:hypothetical protein